jgi:hypothetical protein
MLFGMGYECTLCCVTTKWRISEEVENLELIVGKVQKLRRGDAQMQDGALHHRDQVDQP